MEWRIWINWWIISISDIEGYFEYILKKHGEKAVNPSLRKYIIKIENRITFKIKTGHYLELLTPETVKLLGSTKSKITKFKHGDYVPYLEITGVVLIHRNVLIIVIYKIQEPCIHLFVPNKLFDQLLDISPTSFIFLKTFDSEFSCIEVWFTDQEFKHLERKDKINMVIN